LGGEVKKLRSRGEYAPLGEERVLQAKQRGENLKVGLEAVVVNSIDARTDFTDNFVRHLFVLPTQVDCNLRRGLGIEAIA